MNKARKYVETHAVLEDEYMKFGKNDHVYGVGFGFGADMIRQSRSAFLDAA